MFKTAEVLRAD